MIVYFSDRQMNILGQASTELPEGLTIIDDNMTVDVETGTAIFECYIPYTDTASRQLVSNYAEVGNYLLRSDDGQNEFYQIIETEIDTKKQKVYIYAEDEGMDLLNEVVGEYEATQQQSIAFYINLFSSTSGFVIGINEASDLTRKLSWDSEATAQERIISVAKQFDCEIEFTFDVDGLLVVKKYINIYRKRGQDTGINLRLNFEIDSIITTQSIANLATALKCTGGTPENSDNPITLSGYAYDDGDIYNDNGILKSRKALKRWARLLWKDNDGNTRSGGHITKTFSYDTTSKAELCTRAVAELKRICDAEINYEADITKFPENVHAGDRVNIIDDAGEIYLSTRILTIERSVANNVKRVVLGEYLIKGSGISQKVAYLAEQFAKEAKSAARALSIANEAKTQAETAQTQANTALSNVSAAQTVANEAQTAANTAIESATAANTAAANAQSAVDAVEESVYGLETSIANAEAAAQQAQQAAQTAETKATEAQTAATNAQTAAINAATAAGTAQSTADTAVTNAATAQSAADAAQAAAEAAATTAAAAKTDAEAAQADIDSLGENLTTLSNTMQADYARKTELTEAKSSLQTQITQNAQSITSHAEQITAIDETANNAATQAAAAQSAAAAAQTKADTATADAAAAQAAADTAAANAAAAQTEANTAKTAAATAQSVADQAAADLAEAEADLATVTGRVDSTEEEIAEAQAAVTAAQTAAAAAQADATAAQTAAANAAAAAATAQETANTAKTNAATAQSAADAAAATAAAAQTAADDADAKAAAAAADLVTAKQNLADVTSRVDATEEDVAAAQLAVITAQNKANEAAANAATAQSTADTAKANAATAQSAADTAKAAADAAQADATAAQEAADAAQADVDALAIRVTTAETNITQNATAISLAATKTEVAQSLGGYYTKEQADAALTVKANEIIQSVSETYETKQAADDAATEIHETITEQNTVITQTCQEIILQALTTYTETGDFEEFKETTKSQLELLSNQMTLKFTETQKQLEDTNASLQGQLNTITKYFAFDVNGLIIGQMDSPYKVIIDNDRYSMTVDNSEVMWIANGKVYTPEIEVTKGFKLLGYSIEKDDNGNVNWEYIGGDE